MLLNKPTPLKEPYSFEGGSFVIDVSFNNILEVLQAIDDKSLSDFDKMQVVLYLLTDKDYFLNDEWFDSRGKLQFTKRLFEDLTDKFVKTGKNNAGLPTDIEGNVIPVKKKKEYDFAQDAEYIFSSFMQAYNMNLHEQINKLSWKQFNALFQGLPSDTMIMRVVDIRTRELPSGKHAKKEREALRKAKNEFALEDDDDDDDEHI